MAYCTLTDLKKTADEKLLLRLADDSGMLGSLKEEDYQTGSSTDEEIKAFEACLATIAEATSQADSEIDIHLSDRYLIPLSPVPGIVSGLSARMTVYYLHLRSEAGVDDKWDKAYKRSIDVLVQISKGAVSIGAAPNAMPETSGASEIMVSAPKPIFGEEAWRHF